ncbi:hypothetical protein DPMN_141332 [Dreissena polymorpha]|uniref:Uncharacterized protein n=1 Tax=Dreissena polymorpha TaxID=45954 RepID=A0A9D4G997_DREPO|nr:hypothetical protein DPMN_141332 [Dreissena polymorpha]
MGLEASLNWASRPDRVGPRPVRGVCDSPFDRPSRQGTGVARPELTYPESMVGTTNQTSMFVIAN